MTSRPPVITGLALKALGIMGVLAFAISLTPTSNVYVLETTLNGAPADDIQLYDWVKKQPGVVAHTVGIVRHDAKLVLTLIVSQNYWKSPPFPDVERAASEFGYVIDPRGFIDQRD